MNNTPFKPNSNFLPREPTRNDRGEVQGEEQLVPDGGDIQVISNRRFVQLFMSNKLVLPPDSTKEYTFGFEDLKNIGEVGNGRFGTVCKMIHIPTNYPMAVKRVRLISNQHDDKDDEKRMKQLMQEIKMIQEASTCEEVVRFFGVTFSEGDCLICMEFMDISLHKLYRIVHQVAKQSFNEDVLGIIGVTVLRALNNLKKLKHIIHRDVKPSNILMNLRGYTKLCDFGISGYLEDSMAKTKDIGCRPYMAPERLTASIEGYDIRSDVWSLGITLIETARGTFPYKNFGNQCLFAQVQQVVVGDPPMLLPLDGFSPGTVQFVNKCLTKEYIDRPTYNDLMETDFFNEYTKMQNQIGIVANYVEEMIALEDLLPERTLE